MPAVDGRSSQEMLDTVNQAGERLGRALEEAHQAATGLWYTLSHLDPGD